MDAALFRSPIARIIVGATSLFALVMFLAVWIASLITSGFSLSGTHTFAGWTYFPIFWPHLLTATLGLLLFLRYGANGATAIFVIVSAVVVVVCDTFGTVAYWKLFWLCNISGNGQLSGVASEICSSENPLLISLMVWSTLMWFTSMVAAVAHAFDFFQAARSGSSTPSRRYSAPLAVIILAVTLSFLAFMALFIANLITTGYSIANQQTFAVWAHISLFLIQIPALLLGGMLFVRYGANGATAFAAVALWATAFFSGTYGLAMYWRLGYFCTIASSSTLTGIDLTICTDERDYLIAVWVLVSVLWVAAIGGVIGHAFDFRAATRANTSPINSLVPRNASRVDGYDVVPSPGDDYETGSGGGGESKAGPGDQYGSYNDGARLPAGGAAVVPGSTPSAAIGGAVRSGIAGARKTSHNTARRLTRANHGEW